MRAKSHFLAKGSISVSRKGGADWRFSIASDNSSPSSTLTVGFLCLVNLFHKRYSFDEYSSLFWWGPTFSLSFKRTRSHVTNCQKVKCNSDVMKVLFLCLALVFLRVDAEPVAEGSLSDPEARFLNPLTLEGIGRIFKLQSEIVSCYRCNADYPHHASACCLQGHSNCCVVSNPVLPVNGKHFSLLFIFCQICKRIRNFDSFLVDWSTTAIFTP